MRYLAFILALFIFCMSTLPCTDGHDHTEEAHAEHLSSHSQSHDHVGDCPPFCSCACCGVVIGSVPIFDLAYVPFFKPPLFVAGFHYSFYYSYHHPTRIWQPPTFSTVS